MTAMFVISGLAHGGAILFVDDDAPPGGDGTTWDTAYRSLQDALTTASDPGEGIILVRVGQGTYVPDLSFQLISGVVIAGGYAGFGEPNPNERNIELYLTVLDGQSPHTVVNGSDTSASAVLDGFTITGGDTQVGGGLYLNAGSPTIANCIFNGNQAALSGGAVWMHQSSASFTACTFADNTAPSAGAVNTALSTPVFTDCTFSNNSAEQGGAIFSDESFLLLVGCTFDGNMATGDDGSGGAWQIAGSVSSSIASECTFVNNIADGEGGGINAFMGFITTLTLSNCIFSGNEASEGGAIHLLPQGELLNTQLLDCSFDGNSASSRGGGLSIIGEKAGTTVGIRGCTFTRNVAGTTGGAINILDVDALVVNCTFDQNAAGGGGAIRSETSNVDMTNCLFVDNNSVLGGAMNNAGGDLIATNCSFSGNTADDSGGGMFNSGSVSVRNSVLWGNSDIGGTDESAQIHVIVGATNVNYSCIQGGWSGDGGVGIVTDDPLFVDAKGGDLHLSAGSPCNDAADSSAVPEGITTDLDDGPRFFDDPQRINTGIGDCPIVDMGAYEHQLACLDLDGDKVVGVSDLLLLLAGWGTCEPGDFDGDGSIGLSDLLALLANWGPCP